MHEIWTGGKLKSLENPNSVGDGLAFGPKRDMRCILNHFVNSKFKVSRHEIL